MKLEVRVTYSVNGGTTVHKTMAIEVPDDFRLDDLGQMTLMSNAADLLLDEGQIMISEVTPLGEPELIGAF